MIPQEKNEAVTQALRRTFGVSQFEDIQLMTKGLSSALVFRILVHGTPYLLRIITRTDAMADPTRQFACMQSAAAVGLAPLVWYTSIEDRISITEFVHAIPFPESEALARMPQLLRALHALPPFPKAVNYLDFVDGFVRKFQSAQVLPESETAEAFAHYHRLAAIYPRIDADHVSCHNDLKPENVLFDGQRVWLVDWEAAFLNDRYLDLAVQANFLVTSDAEEKTFLHQYFNQSPDDYQLARFFLMRHILHISYAVVFLFLGSSGQPLTVVEPIPTFRGFHHALWTGEISLESSAMKIAYGRVHWNQFVQAMSAPRWAEALRIVSSQSPLTPSPANSV